MIKTELKTGDYVHVTCKDGTSFKGIVIEEYKGAFTAKILESKGPVACAINPCYGPSKDWRFQIYEGCSSIEVLEKASVVTKSDSASSLSEELRKVNATYYTTPLGHNRYMTLCLSEGYGGWSYHKGSTPKSTVLKEAFARMPSSKKRLSEVTYGRNSSADFKPSDLKSPRWIAMHPDIVSNILTSSDAGNPQFQDRNWIARNPRAVIKYITAQGLDKEGAFSPEQYWAADAAAGGAIPKKPHAPEKSTHVVAKQGTKRMTPTEYTQTVRNIPRDIWHEMTEDEKEAIPYITDFKARQSFIYDMSHDERSEYIRDVLMGGVEPYQITPSGKARVGSESDAADKGDIIPMENRVQRIDNAMRVSIRKVIRESGNKNLGYAGSSYYVDGWEVTPYDLLTTMRNDFVNYVKTEAPELADTIKQLMGTADLLTARDVRALSNTDAQQIIDQFPSEFVADMKINMAAHYEESRENRYKGTWDNFENEATQTSWYVLCTQLKRDGRLVSSDKIPDDLVTQWTKRRKLTTADIEDLQYDVTEAISQLDVSPDSDDMRIIHTIAKRTATSLMRKGVIRNGESTDSEEGSQQVNSMISQSTEGSEDTTILIASLEALAERYFSENPNSPQTRWILFWLEASGLENYGIHNWMQKVHPEFFDPTLKVQPKWGGWNHNVCAEYCSYDRTTGKSAWSNSSHSGYTKLNKEMQDVTEDVLGFDITSWKKKPSRGTGD